MLDIFSLNNLVTRTKNDQIVKIDFNNKVLPNEDYILYLEIALSS